MASVVTCLNNKKFIDEPQQTRLTVKFTWRGLLSFPYNFFLQCMYCMHYFLVHFLLLFFSWSRLTSIWNFQVSKRIKKKEYRLNDIFFNSFPSLEKIGNVGSINLEILATLNLYFSQPPNHLLIWKFCSQLLSWKKKQIS